MGSQRWSIQADIIRGDIMKEQLVKMLSTKRIIALCVTLVFCYLSVMKYFTPTEFLTVMGMVTGYYFGQSTARGSANDAKTQ
jgi:hypothetical protein